ncbi:hypothetical protein M3Y99_01766800 [Aphelenchoides fujianensis]|nr:hypothetical protein M3Y99_01766800 [Aphelenchoides fujianensis]
MLLSALLLPLFLLLPFEASMPAMRLPSTSSTWPMANTKSPRPSASNEPLRRCWSSTRSRSERRANARRPRPKAPTRTPNRTMAELDDGWKVDEYSIDVDDYGCPLNLNYQCNLHNKRFMCTCHQSNVYEKMEYRSCDEVLRVFNPQAYILRFRVRLPDDLRLINVFDEFFADLIESKASIDKQYLFIVRKECVKGKLDVLVAFMRPGFEHENGGETLQVVHPNIFLKNPFFMRNRYVRIYNVSSE